MAPLWEEYPDLRPLTLETEGGIDPVRFRVPREKLAPVREALARLRRASDDALPLVQSGASTPGEERGYLSTAV